MRYFFFSLFIHLIFGIFVMLAGHEHHHTLLNTSIIEIEVVELERPTKSSLLKTLTPKIKKVSKNKNLKKRKLVQTTSQVSQTSAPDQEELDFRHTEPSPAVKLSYAQELKLFIEENKFYPRSALRLKQTGVVKIKMGVNQDGTFENIQIVKASPHPHLNQAALRLIRKLKKFKPLPFEDSEVTSFVVPIAYLMRGGSY